MKNSAGFLLTEETFASNRAYSTKWQQKVSCDLGGLTSFALRVSFGNEYRDKYQKKQRYKEHLFWPHPKRTVDSSPKRGGRAGRQRHPEALCSSFAHAPPSGRTAMRRRLDSTAERLPATNGHQLFAAWTGSRLGFGGQE